MSAVENPFVDDPDRHELWEMLVRRDIDAFVAADWSRTAGDFAPEGFVGLDAGGSDDPTDWRPAFRDLDAYREVWSEQATTLGATAVDLHHDLHTATYLRDIAITGDRALATKRFDGAVLHGDGTRTELRWVTLYICGREAGRWRITGFVGYLPARPGAGRGPGAAKRAPADARQHAGAGPYSPALEVRSEALVVISGQAAIAPDGRVVGDTIEEQTRLTLDNCARQLERVGCGLDDVFKVNVYLHDIAEWSRCNTVYETVFNEPRPVRTAIGAALLPELLVEMDMWAAKP